MGRHRRIRVVVEVGPAFHRGRLDPPEVDHVSQLQDSQATRLNAVVTDAYGEEVDATFAWTTDGAVGPEGNPVLSLVEVAEGDPSGLPAGTYVRAGDDTGSSVVTGTADVNGADGNPIVVFEGFDIVASAATSASVTNDDPIDKTTLPA